MYPNVTSLVLAGAFTAGCVIIHAQRERADEIAVVLVLALIGLANLLGASLAFRMDLPAALAPAAEIAIQHSRID